MVVFKGDFAGHFLEVGTGLCRSFDAAEGEIDFASSTGSAGELDLDLILRVGR